MHVGGANILLSRFVQDSWRVGTIDEFDTKSEEESDTFEGESKMDNSKEEKCLGYLICADGSNEKNIKARRAKGFGIVDQIISMLNDICFGPHVFQVAMVLRSSLFINSILFNSEVWYGITKAEIETLETVDNFLLKKILDAPCTTPTPMLYLELGCVPIRFILISRRIMYLQYLLNQEETSLLHKFSKAQLENPSQGD